MNLCTYISAHTIHFNLMNPLLNHEIDSINIFGFSNIDAMQPWVTLYEEKRSKWDSDMK